MLLREEIIDEQKASKLLYDSFYSVDVKCPSCGKIMDREKIFNGKVYVCKCGKKFNWRVETIFEGSKMSSAKLVMLIDMILDNKPDKQILSRIDITQDTLRVWKYKIDVIRRKEAMNNEKETSNS